MEFFGRFDDPDLFRFPRENTAEERIIPLSLIKYFFISIPVATIHDGMNGLVDLEEESELREYLVIFFDIVPECSGDADGILDIEVDADDSRRRYRVDDIRFAGLPFFLP